MASGLMTKQAAWLAGVLVLLLLVAQTRKIIDRLYRLGVQVRRFLAAYFH